MKRILTVIALMVVSATMAHAQLGIIGGVTLSDTNLDTKNIMENAKNVNLYHVGVAYKADMGMGFALQPALSYQMKGANLQETLDASDPTAVPGTLETKTGYAEFSLGIQFGIDLLAFRPYIFAEPFVGYQLTGNEDFRNAATTAAYDEDQRNAAIQEAKNKLEYGFGVGIGVDLLSHLQLSVQYFMNLGALYQDGNIDGNAMWNAVKGSYKDINNYQGVKVSLALFF